MRRSLGNNVQCYKSYLYEADKMNTSFSLPRLCDANSEMPLWGNKLLRMEGRGALETCATIEAHLKTQDPNTQEYLNQIVTRIVRAEYEGALSALHNSTNPLESIDPFHVALLKAQLRALCGEELKLGSLYAAALTAQGAVAPGLLDSTELAPDLFRAEVLGALGALKCTQYLKGRTHNSSDTKVTENFAGALRRFSSLSPDQQSKTLPNMVAMTRALFHETVPHSYREVFAKLREELAPHIMASVQTIAQSTAASPTERFRALLIKVLCAPKSPLDPRSIQMLDQDIKTLFHAARSSLRADPQETPIRPEAAFGDVQMVAELCRNNGNLSGALELYQRLASLPDITLTQHRALLIDAFIKQIRINHTLMDTNSCKELPDLTRNRALRNFYGDAAACAEIEIAWAKCLNISPDSRNYATNNRLRNLMSQQVLVLEEIQEKPLPTQLLAEAERQADALRRQLNTFASAPFAREWRRW